MIAYHTTDEDIVWLELSGYKILNHKLLEEFPFQYSTLNEYRFQDKDLIIRVSDYIALDDIYVKNDDGCCWSFERGDSAVSFQPLYGHTDIFSRDYLGIYTHYIHTYDGEFVCNVQFAGGKTDINFDRHYDDYIEELFVHVSLLR